jgi:hypothetical protein
VIRLQPDLVGVAGAGRPEGRQRVRLAGPDCRNAIDREEIDPGISRDAAEEGSKPSGRNLSGRPRRHEGKVEVGVLSADAGCDPKPGPAFH